MVPEISTGTRKRIRYRHTLLSLHNCPCTALASEIHPSAKELESTMTLAFPLSFFSLCASLNDALTFKMFYCMLQLAILMMARLESSRPQTPKWSILKMPRSPSLLSVDFSLAFKSSSCLSMTFAQILFYVFTVSTSIAQL